MASTSDEDDPRVLPASDPPGEPEWETCEIRLEVPPPSYGFRVYRFRAIIDGPDSRKLAVPVKDVFHPARERLAAGVEELRATLHAAGWEEMWLAPGKEWYSYRFRRLISRSIDGSLPGAP